MRVGFLRVSTLMSFRVTGTFSSATDPIGPISEGYKSFLLSSTSSYFLCFLSACRWRSFLFTGSESLERLECRGPIVVYWMVSPTP